MGQHAPGTFLQHRRLQPGIPEMNKPHERGCKSPARYLSSNQIYCAPHVKDTECENLINIVFLMPSSPICNGLMTNIVFLIPTSPIYNGNVVDFFAGQSAVNAIYRKSGKSGENIVFKIFVIRFVNVNWVEY